MTQLMTAERVGPAETRVPELEKPSPVPAWVPDGTDLEYVPDRVKQSMREIVQPLYDRLVVEARHPLDRSLGMTLAHMTWLEILDEEDHRREYTEILSVLKLAQNRESKIQHHVRMLEAKIRVGKFLLQLEETRRRWDREDERDRPAAPSPCGPPARDLRARAFRLRPAVGAGLVPRRGPRGADARPGRVGRPSGRTTRPGAGARRNRIATTPRQRTRRFARRRASRPRNPLLWGRNVRKRAGWRPQFSLRRGRRSAERTARRPRNPTLPRGNQGLERFGFLGWGSGA